MVPLSKHKFVTVNPEDILPKKKERNRYEESAKKFNNEAQEQMDQASIRFNNVIIEPQKKIIREELYHSYDGSSIDTTKTLAKIKGFFDLVTDIRSEVGEKFDKIEAVHQVRNSIVSADYDENGLDKFFEEEDLNKLGFFNNDDKTLYIKYNDNVDSLLWDDDDEVPSNKKQQSNIIHAKPKESESDSYDIDPSLFDD